MSNESEKVCKTQEKSEKSLWSVLNFGTVSRMSWFLLFDLIVCFFRTNFIFWHTKKSSSHFLTILTLNVSRVDICRKKLETLWNVWRKKKRQKKKKQYHFHFFPFRRHSNNSWHWRVVRRCVTNTLFVLWNTAFNDFGCKEFCLTARPGWVFKKLRKSNF